MQAPPEHHHLRRKAWITTGLAMLIWALVAGIILFGNIDIKSFSLREYFQG